MAQKPATRSIGIGDTAPPLKVAKWLKGTPVKSLGKGKIHVVEFWATWCGPCKVSIPHLTELAHKYKGKATFTGVSVWEHHAPGDVSYLKNVDSFVKEMGEKMDYNIAAEGTEGAMAASWMTAAGQDGIPTAFVIDPKGKIAWIGHPMDGLDEAVGKMIAGKLDVKAEAEKARKQKEENAKRELMYAPLKAKLVAKDHRGAVEEVDKLIAAHPEMKNQFAMFRFMEQLKFDEAAAQKTAAELGDGMLKDSAEGLNQIAWTLVDEKTGVKNLDTALALRLATRAADLTKHEEPNILDTLAVAYFRAGQMDEALATEKKAVSIAEGTKEFDAASLKEMKARLEQYTKAKG
ncbi:thiol-disulfide isomerase-like thioredoxin [Fimbriimonas ginsengisoli Gsoil 348]|uniref:Thiol-disulfide isomerase-like thioredoxin n=2 Tax=Fimbriimonas ginsengisoli TaxID=1005039 RepID=A0A068NIN4_FIMGI|nr:TlpA disulfide reductase family protein [Fimbriimonas ginsengisoli]AIE83463.1 thiol-disulfide isomerase-like thioredoxin [Fimbriimonas ginsengisoli Gsoil 348]